MAESPVLYEKTGDGVARVTLNRPDVLNAINMRMRDDMWEIMHAVRDDPDVRVVVFRGAGDRAFSAGADIGEFGTAPSYVEARRARRERDLWWFMLNMEEILIAAVYGYAFGAGIELPICCDIRIAAEDATMALPEVSLGYIPSAGGTQTLPRHVPSGLAMQMILTGDPIGAAEAFHAGLVQKVVPRGILYAEAEALALRIASLPPHVAGLLKRAVNEGAELPLDNGLALEWVLTERALVARR